MDAEEIFCWVFYDSVMACRLHESNEVIV